MPTKPRVWWTVLGSLALILGLPSSRALGDHRIPAGVILNVRTLQTIDAYSAWPGMKVSAVVDAPVVVGGHIVLPQGAPARLEVVDVRRSPNGRDRITLRALWIESRDRISWVAANEVVFERGNGETYVRIPAETWMQFQLNTCAKVE